MSEVIDRTVQQLGYTATKEHQRTDLWVAKMYSVYCRLDTETGRGGELPWIRGVTILVRKRCMRMGTRLEWGYAECAYEKVHWYGYCMLKRPDPFLLMRKGRVPRLDILLVVNCASICANHSSGSAGQKGGSLMEMALAAATGGGSMGSASMGSTMGGSVGSGIETFVCCQGSPM